MSKNRKAFFYVLQFGKHPENKDKVIARIYRLKRNKPVFLGFVEYKKGDYEQHKIQVQNYLKNHGHICRNHVAEKDFMLEAV